MAFSWGLGAILVEWSVVARITARKEGTFFVVSKVARSFDLAVPA